MGKGNSMKLICPLDNYIYISQTYQDHVNRAYANGWCPYPGKCNSGVYYYGGIDYAVSPTPDKAAAEGDVILVNYSNYGYGYEVRIDHGDGFITIYGHHSKINVTKGQHVLQGQNIGITGTTGNSTGPHLHFELRLNGSPVDPEPYFEKEDVMHGQVLVNQLAVRTKPSASGAGMVKRRLQSGAIIEISEIDTIWVKLNDGTYVAARYMGDDLVKIGEGKIIIE